MIEECIAALAYYLGVAERKIKGEEEEILVYHSDYSYHSEMAISQLKWLIESKVAFVQTQQTMESK